MTRTAPVEVPGADDLRLVADEVLALMAALPDDAWDAATVPPQRRGFHPRGLSDASGFAATGIVETVLHSHDVLTAHDVPYRADPDAVRRTLDRLFPGAVRTDDPWRDLLTAGGRTEQTRGRPWGWDSTVRPAHGPRPGRTTRAVTAALRRVAVADTLSLLT